MRNVLPEMAVVDSAEVLAKHTSDNMPERRMKQCVS
jgi:hypothetical protein